MTKQLKLTRPIVCFDIESTGVDISKDRIIDIAFLKNMPSGEVFTVYYRVNPGVSIPEEATSVHGISNDDVKDVPPFEEYAQSIVEFITGCDFCGFNLINYDLPLLQEELLRAGYCLPKDANIIDAGNIFKKKEERTLSAAVQFYLNKSHEGAHGAIADTEATFDVLLKQIEVYPDLPETVEELAEFSKFGKRLDWAGKFTSDDNGVPHYNFGKYKGRPVSDDPTYLQWMMGANFTHDTKMWCARFLEQWRQNQSFA